MECPYNEFFGGENCPDCGRYKYCRADDEFSMREDELMEESYYRRVGEYLEGGDVL